jgi:hypothetical protein
MFLFCFLSFVLLDTAGFYFCVMNDTSSYGLTLRCFVRMPAVG